MSKTKSKSNPFPIEVPRLREQLTQWFADNPPRERARNRRELLEQLRSYLLEKQREGRTVEDIMLALGTLDIECSCSTIKSALGGARRPKLLVESETEK